jgi:hypothetical protein
MLFTWNDSLFVKICFVFDSCQTEYNKNVSFLHSYFIGWLISSQPINMSYFGSTEPLRLPKLHSEHNNFFIWLFFT